LVEIRMVYVSDGVLVWEKSSNLFFALEVVSVFVNRVMHHGVGVLLLEIRLIVSSADALQIDCGCVHLRCYGVQVFAIGEEMYGETMLYRDYHERLRGSAVASRSFAHCSLLLARTSLLL